MALFKGVTCIVLKSFYFKSSLIDEEDAVATENCHDRVSLIDSYFVDLVLGICALTKSLAIAVVEVVL